VLDGEDGAVNLGAVTVQHAAGNVTAYVPASNTDRARGMALIAAVKAAVAGEVVSLGPGAFDVQTVSLPTAGKTGLVIRGCGFDRTTINWEGTNGGLIVPSNNMRIQDLTLNSTLNTYQFALINNSLLGGGASGLVLSGVRIFGDTDGIDFISTTNWTAYDCHFEGRWDVIFHENAGAATLWNSTILVTGPSSQGGGQDASGVKMTAGSIRMIGGFITVSGASLDNVGAVVGGPGGALDLQGVTFNVSGAGALDIKITGGSVNIGPGTRRADNAPLVISKSGGTVTYGSPPVVPSYTVATLPTGALGMLAYVTDATLTAITGLGLAPTGGGSNKVPVTFDGASWKIL